MAKYKVAFPLFRNLKVTLLNLRFMLLNLRFTTLILPFPVPTYDA